MRLHYHRISPTHNPPYACCTYVQRARYDVVGKLLPLGFPHDIHNTVSVCVARRLAGRAYCTQPTINHAVRTLNVFYI